VTTCAHCGTEYNVNLGDEHTAKHCLAVQLAAANARCKALEAERDEYLNLVTHDNGKLGLQMQVEALTRRVATLEKALRYCVEDNYCDFNCKPDDARPCMFCACQRVLAASQAPRKDGET
jgi:hypothetical protein